ncbi:MAG: late competence development ComFB family protein [Oscillospiraceae bacterium]|nr:late competence development ComFB family protein [Oscillospiraceae bacterium]
MPPKKINKTSHVLNLIAPEDGRSETAFPSQKEDSRQGNLGDIIAEQLQGELDKTIEENRSAAVKTAPAAGTATSSENSGDIKSESEIKKMDDPLLTINRDESADEYVAINIVEDIVKTKAKAFVKKFGICDCHRCVSDVIAIALNDLPSRYTVTHKGMLYSKIASYENQYSADINHALTKACMVVGESPRH